MFAFHSVAVNAPPGRCEPTAVPRLRAVPGEEPGCIDCQPQAAACAPCCSPGKMPVLSELTEAKREEFSAENSLTADHGAVLALSMRGQSSRGVQHPGPRGACGSSADFITCTSCLGHLSADHQLHLHSTSKVCPGTQSHDQAGGKMLHEGSTASSVEMKLPSFPCSTWLW